MTARILCAAAAALLWIAAAHAQVGAPDASSAGVFVQSPEPEITGGVQAASEHLPTLTQREREIARRHARGRSVKPVDVEIEIGELLPEMELHSFSEAVQRKAPALRGYRYFVIEDEVVLVDPEGPRIVDVIDE